MELRAGQRAAAGLVSSHRCVSAMRSGAISRTGTALPAPPVPARHDLVVGPWGARFFGRRFPCSIGRRGVVPEEAKVEGDLSTPIGTYRLLWLYWRADRLAR